MKKSLFNWCLRFGICFMLFFVFVNLFHVGSNLLGYIVFVILSVILFCLVEFNVNDKLKV